MIVQAFTCQSVIEPIVALGMKPIFVDISEKDFSLDIENLKEKLADNTRVIILQHTFGIKPENRDKVVELAMKNQLILIEDLAHGLMSTSLATKEKFLNHFFLLSFGRSKSLSSVFGGGVVSQNRKIIKLLDHGGLEYPSYSFIMKCLLYKPIVVTVKTTYRIFIGKLIHKLAQGLGLLAAELTPEEKEGNFDQLLNKKYPNALAKLLLNQLKKLEKNNYQRAQVVNFYVNNLSSLRKIINTRTLHRYQNQPLVRFPLLLDQRDRVISHLEQKKIFLDTWYDSIIAPKTFPLKTLPGESRRSLNTCTVAFRLTKKIINLPTLIEIDQAKIILNELKKAIGD